MSPGSQELAELIEALLLAPGKAGKAAGAPRLSGPVRAPLEHILTELRSPEPEGPRSAGLLARLVLDVCQARIEQRYEIDAQGAFRALPAPRPGTPRRIITIGHLHHPHLSVPAREAAEAFLAHVVNQLERARLAPLLQIFTYLAGRRELIDALARGITHRLAPPAAPADESALLAQALKSMLSSASVRQLRKLLEVRALLATGTTAHSRLLVQYLDERLGTAPSTGDVLDASTPPPAATRTRSRRR